MDRQAILGSKISLISRAGIRYEGILYTIDSQNSTVALAKVKSFGTEDRCTDHVISARPEVYDYIIFRGNDIQDLHVCEPPTPKDRLMTQDPSIVKVAGRATKERSSFSYPRKFERGRMVERFEDDFSRRSNFNRMFNYSRRQSSYYSETPRWQQSVSPNRRERSMPMEYVPRRYRPPTPRRWRSNSQNRPSSTTKSYEKDYDFETANAEIAKELERLTIEQTEVCGGDGDSEGTRALEEGGSGENICNTTSNHGDTNIYYNSKRSFFDNISSEVTDRAKGKTIRPLNWRDERKLNVETFGAPRLRRIFLKMDSRQGNYYRRSRSRRNDYNMGSPDDYYYYYQYNRRGMRSRR